MRILVVHNHYRQPGGEDAVFAAEVELLRDHGHDVMTWEEHNHNLQDEPAWRVATTMIWSRAGRQHLAGLLAHRRPELVHFHNTFVRISPAAYYACRQADLPVVQTLHNYRLLCPAATFFRDGHVCEECLGKPIAYPGAWHACWRNSRAQSAAVAGMLAVHRLLGTWQQQITRFIALTEFARVKFIAGGIQASKIVCKPNFCDAPDELASAGQRRPFALFVGRLTPEKGLPILLDVWQRLPRIPLTVVGDGPQAGSIAAQAHAGTAAIYMTGQVDHATVMRLMQQARFLVFPSAWYEGFPMTIVEAFANRLPVIAPRLGSMAELVTDGHTGLHFEPQSAHDLAAKVAWAWQHPDEMAVMGEAAYRTYQDHYTPEHNYTQLMAIYEQALTAHAQHR
jgi:glycosyltransferase involved in cell wall biosynthesis